MLFSMHRDMKAMSIELLYQVVNNCNADNSRAAGLIKEWAEYYISEKFKGNYS